MNVGLPLLPAILVDIIGSAAMLVFSFLSLRYAYLLTRRQPQNFLWGYLFYVTIAIAAFAISRAVGHLVKQFLLIAGHSEIWTFLSPYSGGFNTLFMISVSAVMIFYHKGVQAYELLETEAIKLKTANRDLAAAAQQLRDLNQNLEEKVEERTEKLARSEKKYRHLFSASKDIVFFCQADGRGIDMNDAGLQALGYLPERMHGMQLAELLFNTEDFGGIQERLQTDGYIHDFDLNLLRQDGSPLPVLLSAAAIFGEHGEMIGSEIIGKDLSRLKTVMEQLAASEKMASVGQMAAGVAHEINTPLGIILGYTQLLKDDCPRDSEQYQALEVIERQTKASRKIVADLLKFSRQSGASKEQVDMNILIEEVAALSKRNPGHRPAFIKCSYDQNLPAVVGDPQKLRQVFINLLNNAYHAIEEQTNAIIQLSTRYLPAERQVVITVQDNGYGVAEKNRTKIFDPFFTTKPVGQGTGLGLSVSYGIIQEHGGSISLESTTLAETAGQSCGSLFTITLPATAGNGHQTVAH